MEKKKEKIILRESDLTNADKVIENEKKLFDTKLVASFGNVMYYLPIVFGSYILKVNSERMIISYKQIKKCTVTEIWYETGEPVLLHGITTTGDQISGIQELFFDSLNDAKEVINEINRFYSKENVTSLTFDTYMEFVKPKYKYWLRFPIEPGDIILEPDSHYMAERIHAEISLDFPDVQCLGKNNLKYEAGKRVFSIESIFSRPLYKIEKIEDV